MAEPAVDIGSAAPQRVILTLERPLPFDLADQLVARGLSAAAFCRHTGLGAQTVSLMLHGKDPSPRTRARVIQALREIPSLGSIESDAPTSSATS